MQHVLLVTLVTFNILHDLNQQHLEKFVDVLAMIFTQRVFRGLGLIQVPIFAEDFCPENCALCLSKFLLFAISTLKLQLLNCTQAQFFLLD